jgi:NhaP-type Na+/H+ or K+/H+ antiporter
MILIATFVALVFVYSLLSRRLERTVITAPIVFTSAGVLMAYVPQAMTALALDRTSLLLVAELGLVMTLFTDASRIAPRMLAGRGNLPLRLLATGMPLTLVLGALCALVVLGELKWWEAGILTAILAPTDAGLGQVVVNSSAVPARIRQALNVEAGLNDGLSVPFLLFFIALAAAEGAGTLGSGALARYLLEQLGYGLLIGLAIGLPGGWLLERALRHEWMASAMAQLGVVALPIACMLAAEAGGASMFIAAFVAGIAAQVGYREIGRHSVEFAEEWGQLFNFFVFFLFGLLSGRVLGEFSAAILLYAVLSLTLVRMLPVAVALRGTGLSRASVLFIGWFGPRGLASIVLGLVYLEQELGLAGESTIRLAVMATVLISIYAHGLSAAPGIRRYAKAIETLAPGAPEHQADAAQQPR